MDVNQKILEIIRSKGPIIPSQIAKETKESLLFSSARLAELLSSKHLKISHIKIGGSPLYYLAGQESRLQEFSTYLKGPEKDAFMLLQQQQIIDETAQEPVVRVALRNMKDFAIPLEVIYNNEKKIFWKWYLLSSDAVQEKIRQHLNPSTKTVELMAKPQATEPKKEQQSESVQGASAAVQQELVQKQPIPIQQQALIPLTLSSPTQHALPQKRTIQKKITQEESKLDQAQTQNIEKTAKEASPRQDTISKQEITRAPLLTDSKEKLQKESVAQNTEKKETSKPSGTFAKKIQSYFEIRNIQIIEFSEVKKNTELNYIVEMDSVIGKLRYFCKAKQKKIINDADLSSALIQAQAANLPLLFLTTGTISKKTHEQLTKELKNIIFRTI